MGEAGSGKSSFIQRVTGRNDVHINHGLERGPPKIRTYEVTLKSSDKVRLFDFPGFDDVSMADKAIVNAILDRLEQMYREMLQLHGIIYMFNIDKPRVSDFTLRNIAVFKRLVGEDFYRNEILCTTCWDKLHDEHECTVREKQLLGTPELWDDLASRGSRIRRTGIQRSQEESSTTSRHLIATRDLSVIYEIVQTHQPQWTAAQEEMASGLMFSETSASREVDEGALLAGSPSPGGKA